MRQVMAARLIKLSRSFLLKPLRSDNKELAAYYNQLNDRLAEHVSGKKKGSNPATANKEPFFERIEDRVEATEIVS